MSSAHHEYIYGRALLNLTAQTAGDAMSNSRPVSQSQRAREADTHGQRAKERMDTRMSESLHKQESQRERAHTGGMHTFVAVEEVQKLLSSDHAITSHVMPIERGNRLHADAELEFPLSY